MKRVIIAGVGPGSKSCLTEEVKEAIDNSEVLIGSKRLIEEYTDKKTFYAVTAKDIIDIIDNENAKNYVVLMSGDTGFYSGAKKLAEALAGKYEYSIMAGVSSVIYLAAKIGKSWENAAFVSLHGKKQSYIPVVLQNELTYFLTQGNVSQICQELYRAGLGQAHIWIGENLSYDNEKITNGNVSEFTEYISEGLTVLLSVSNVTAVTTIWTYGFFLRILLKMYSNSPPLPPINTLSGTGRLSITAAALPCIISILLSPNFSAFLAIRLQPSSVLSTAYTVP